jgi:hypothetical protein
MGFIALIAWFITVLGGLYMLAVWLIENDATNQRNSASRLPLPVILTHMTLAITGLALWISYLLLDRDALAWGALGLLGLIAFLGVAMFARWIPVYRTVGAPAEPVPVPASTYPSAFGGAQPASAALAIEASFDDTPPEGNFPLVVVVAHGLFAALTITLVLLSALGVGGS